MHHITAIGSGTGQFRRICRICRLQDDGLLLITLHRAIKFLCTAVRYLIHPGVQTNYIPGLCLRHGLCQLRRIGNRHLPARIGQKSSLHQAKIHPVQHTVSVQIPCLPIRQGHFLPQQPILQQCHILRIRCPICIHIPGSIRCLSAHAKEHRQQCSGQQQTDPIHSSHFLPPYRNAPIPSRNRERFFTITLHHAVQVISCGTVPLAASRSLRRLAKTS